MFASLFTGIGLKIMGVVAALGILGGAYVWITTAAYNRGKAAGAAEVTARMTAAIRKQADAVKRDMAKLRQLGPAELDKKLEELCRQAGGGDACAP